MASVHDKSSRTSAPDSGLAGSYETRPTPLDTNLSNQSNLQGSQPSAVTGVGDEKAKARGRVGATINSKWRLDSLLGVGGMASVYAATHRNGSRAALKILHMEFARDAGIRERFLREGYVANKVDHPGRVAILDDDVTEQDEPFLVMELLEGETVQQLWKRHKRKVPVEDALGIADAVLDTLTEFHTQGIVHRDLKPANVFVTREGAVKLLDFGVARMRDAGGDKTRAGTALGTPSFMAPEQAMGLTDNVDGRADIFSVGATLYALLSGQRLHQGRSDNEAFILAATQPAPSLARVASDIPTPVIALVDKALAWDPRSRFQDVTAMREEIRRILGRPAGEAPGVRSRPGDAAPSRARDVEIEIIEEVTQDAVAAADDPVVLRLMELFRRLDRLLPAVRQYGWQHPDADNKLRASFQAVIDTLRESGKVVGWTLRPYSFMHRGHSVWEPASPYDAIPYNLFAAGIREMSLSPGITEEEIRALCEVWLIDPNHDLAPEDDIAAALWERRLQHVSFEAIDVFAEGDAAAREHFYQESDDVERMAREAVERRANQAEAAALVVDTDPAALKAARDAASVLGLDPVAKKALGAQLTMSAERWTERFFDVLVDAFATARRRNDLALLTEPLDASVRDMVLDRRFDMAFALHDGIGRALVGTAARAELEHVRASITAGLFTPDTLRLLLREAMRATAQAGQAQPHEGGGKPAATREVDVDAVAAGLVPILNDLSAEHLDAVMDVLAAVTHEGLRRVLLSYVERVMPGRETEIVDRVMMLEIDVARQVMGAIAAVRSPSAHAALQRLASSSNANIRCEAIALIAASPDQLRDALMQLADAPDQQMRCAALRTLARHQVRAAGPMLVRRISDASFQQLSPDDRRELLAALYALNPARAEQLAIELLGKHGLLVDEPFDQTRAACAELLGREAKSEAALEAVVAATRRRPWNSALLRETAQLAAESVATRLGKRITASGEIQ